MSRFNKRLGSIKPSPIRAFDEEVGQLENIIKLTLGEPDFDTPEKVKQAGIQAIKDNFSHYSQNPGLLELREAIAGFMKEKYHVVYDPVNEITVSVGATEAYASSLLAILNPGDVVLIPSPAFPGYQPVISMAGAEIVHMDTSATDFILKKEQLEENLEKYGDRVKVVLLNYPTNPTGVTYDREAVKEIADVIKQHDIFVLSDEIYSELVYEEEHVSIAEYLPEQTILIHGVSKSHAMTGWRIGFSLAPAEITQEIRKVHQFIVTAASTISQKAAATALTESKDEGLVMRQAYKERRDFMISSLNELGFECAKPSGAFYIFAKIPSDFGLTSMEFCRELAYNNRVAVIPGHAFGPGGEGYVRISYAASMENLQEAVKRISDYVENKKQQG
ncbi:pyridoxal phosphate-dependent aminotransferase [Vagococcus elongatus]|uniref:Aminotransferase n=1 Tax=Vagococcus elongatus TaxID=180344 RepID=A0A430APT4_9ENTE|nr:pyridoxal phosphate-dependent aminotransferase [Vagococcus elongatus]RSU10132.1 aromatic amino acid aminotransferase [Vagococcus elongatus]